MMPSELELKLNDAGREIDELGNTLSELHEESDRRLGLLKRVNTVRVYAGKPCPVCLKEPKLKLIGDSISPVDNHAADCELAEELEGSE
jgi:hypothetical protein